jgi:hypothetical protein
MKTGIALHILHNLAPGFLQYMREWPERTSQNGKLNKAKTTKGNEL